MRTLLLLLIASTVLYSWVHAQYDPYDQSYLEIPNPIFENLSKEEQDKLLLREQERRREVLRRYKEQRSQAKRDHKGHTEG